MAMSFAVRRPADARNRFNADSDSDEEREGSSQAISSFDGRRGLTSKQSKAGKSSQSGSSQEGSSLVIPSQKNKDWKQEAAKLRAMKNGGRYRPGMGDESGRGQGKQYTEEEIENATRITSNVEGGLAMGKRSIPAAIQPGDKTPLGPQEGSPPPAVSPKAEEPETADQKALKALLRGASGQEDEEQADIEAIHGDTQNNFWDRHNKDQPVGEEDLFRADVLSRPDSASMNDYERVPVDAFGAALLRGMYASGDTSKRTTPMEPYVPKARPNLLGIGAKELDLGEDKNSRSAKDKERQRKKESMHFVPLMKKERPRAEQDLPMLPPPAVASKSSKDKERREERSSSSRKYRDESPPSRSSSSRRDRDRDDDRYSSKSSSSSRRDRDREDDDYYRSSSSSSRRRSRSPPRSESRRDRDKDRSRDKDRYSRESERDRDRDYRRKRNY